MISFPNQYTGRRCSVAYKHGIQGTFRVGRSISSWLFVILLPTSFFRSYSLTHARSSIFSILRPPRYLLIVSVGQFCKKRVLMALRWKRGSLFSFQRYLVSTALFWKAIVFSLNGSAAVSWYSCRQTGPNSVNPPVPPPALGAAEDPLKADRKVSGIVSRS